MPLGAVLGKSFATRIGDQIVAARTAVFDAFVGIDHAFALQFVECGVEGAFFEIEDALGALFDLLGDAIAVGGFADEGFEDEGGEGPFEVHLIHCIPMHRKSLIAGIVNEKLLDFAL